MSTSPHVAIVIPDGDAGCCLWAVTRSDDPGVTCWVQDVRLTWFSGSDVVAASLIHYEAWDTPSLRSGGSDVIVTSYIHYEAWDANVGDSCAGL